MSLTTAAIAERALRFHALHRGDGVLLLPNAWDVITARVFEQAGFAALGTTSFGIARAHGFRDGEDAAYDVTLDMVRRIAPALSVPLTADIEAGYGDTPEEVGARGRELLQAGAVGFNIEDGSLRDPSGLADAALQSEKVAALKEAGASLGIPVFVNARTDVFWRDPNAGASGLAAALRRAEVYLSAGADGIFIPGLTDREAIRTAAAALKAPLNILATPRTPPVAALASLGVKRLSLGSGPVRAALGCLRAIGREILEQGTYRFLDDAVPYDEANEL
jgi:2-methylisocitrate lyase-like PEP mutase family enzyme